MTLRAMRKDTRPGEFVLAPADDAYQIPGGNISEDDWQRLSPEARRIVRESGLYDVRTDAEMKPSGQAAPKGGG